MRVHPLSASIGNGKQPCFLCWGLPFRSQAASGAADVTAPRVDGAINRYKDHRHFARETHDYGFAHRGEQDLFNHGASLDGDPRFAASPRSFGGLSRARLQVCRGREIVRCSRGTAPNIWTEHRFKPWLSSESVCS